MTSRFGGEECGSLLRMALEVGVTHTKPLLWVVFKDSNKGGPILGLPSASFFP